MDGGELFESLLRQRQARKLRSRLILTLASALLPISIILIVLGDKSGFLSSYPMTADVIASIPLALFGYLVVERWIANREAKRFEIIAQLAYKSLAASTREVVEQLNQSEINDYLNKQSEAIPANVRQSAYSLTGNLRAGIRETAAQWTPLLLATREGVEYLDAFVHLNRLIGDIRRALDDFDHPQSGGGRALHNSWRCTDSFSRKLSNALWELCGSRLRFPDVELGSEPILLR